MLKPFVFPPIILPMIPTSILMDIQSSEIWLVVLLAVALIGVSVLVGWILTNVMRKKQYKNSIAINMTLSGVMSLTLLLRYGFSMTTVQGIILMFILLYASCSDLTDHTMDDFLWVMVVILGLLSAETVGFPSMLIGAVTVFLPQIFSAVLAKNPIGGADIKLTTALAFLLGWQRGLIMLITGMLLAVVVMLIARKYEKNKKGQPFALIPFVSAATMVAFFV